MSTPNHKQEIHDHLKSSFLQDWGDENDFDDYPDGNKNKYHITTEFRRVRPSEFGDMVKNKIGTCRGVILLSHIASNYSSRHMLGKKYDVSYSTVILFGTSAIKQSQITGSDRIVYEMEANIMQTLIDHPIQITGNPSISLSVEDMENEYTDSDIDFNRLRLNFTARFKHYA